MTHLDTRFRDPTRWQVYCFLKPDNAGGFRTSADRQSAHHPVQPAGTPSRSTQELIDAAWNLVGEQLHIAVGDISPPSLAALKDRGAGLAVNTGVIDHHLAPPDQAAVPHLTLDLISLHDVVLLRLREEIEGEYAQHELPNFHNILAPIFQGVMNRDFLGKCEIFSVETVGPCTAESLSDLVRHCGPESAPRLLTPLQSQPNGDAQVTWTNAAMSAGDLFVWTVLPGSNELFYNDVLTRWPQLACCAIKVHNSIRNVEFYLAEAMTVVDRFRRSRANPQQQQPSDPATLDLPALRQLNLQLTKDRLALSHAVNCTRAELHTISINRSNLLNALPATAIREPDHLPLVRHLIDAQVDGVVRQTESDLEYCELTARQLEIQFASLEVAVDHHEAQESRNIGGIMLGLTCAQVVGLLKEVVPAEKWNCWPPATRFSAILFAVLLLFTLSVWVMHWRRQRR